MNITTSRPKFIWSLFKDSFSEFMEDNGLKLSAALSYYTIFSLAPMLLVIISIVSIVFGKEAFQGELFGQISGLVGKEAAAQLQDLIKNAELSNKSGIAATVGIVTLLIGATGVFAEIQDSINYIWSIKSKPKKGWLQYLKNRLLSFSIILTLGFLLIVSLGINTLVDLMSAQLERYFSEVSVIFFSVLNVVVVMAVITALFTVIFKVLPDGHVRWKECMVGAAFTAVLFAIGKFAISFYLGKQDLGATYGASASIVILLTWVYYSSIILYFGAEFTKVYARTDGVNISPNEHAVLMVRREVEQENPAEAIKEADTNTFSPKEVTHKVMDTVTQFIDDKLNAIRAEIKAKIAEFTAPFSFYAYAAVIVFLIVITVVVLLGHFLNNAFNSDYLGFVVLLGFTLVLFSLCFIFRENLLESIRRMIAKRVQTKNEEQKQTLS
ncbi:YihY/virulence factor BrkB family protein [Dyadobacter chenwenxiniae]|uniref:YihY/virulence factor BrkB family protein n=1 Tax=Dyadobacter chenwenxiniae TaxID=2906456 RepID=A0A9X1PQ66_9BACT|nr:YihY/virulence factor BrkB family protein [Dyadobacter chenwenxiniae]MCF0064460.1 YihY/virulence factor BrkB family protein [Dyadobacter chenwenxiniae]UON82337.1 YihY/virulence factor BrkB family protein [Dyadobacter chenwenxiniae]